MNSQFGSTDPTKEVSLGVFSVISVRHVIKLVRAGPKGILIPSNVFSFLNILSCLNSVSVKYYRKTKTI